MTVGFIITRKFGKIINLAHFVVIRSTKSRVRCIKYRNKFIMEINVDPISYNKTTKKRLALEKNKFTDTLHYQSVRAFRVSLKTFIELV